MAAHTGISIRDGMTQTIDAFTRRERRFENDDFPAEQLREHDIPYAGAFTSRAA